MDIRKKYPNIIPGLGKVTTPFGGKTETENPHMAIDVANKNGTPIKATVTGKIVGIERKKTDFGNSVLLRDSKGNIHRYSHLKQIFIHVGDKVKKGDQIASMGDTGNSYSPSGGDASHLDYRITGKGGKEINPTNILKKAYGSK